MTITTIRAFLLQSGGNIQPGTRSRALHASSYSDGHSPFRRIWHVEPNGCLPAFLFLMGISANGQTSSFAGEAHPTVGSSIAVTAGSSNFGTPMFISGHVMMTDG